MLRDDQQAPGSVPRFVSIDSRVQAGCSHVFWWSLGNEGAQKPSSVMSDCGHSAFQTPRAPTDYSQALSSSRAHSSTMASVDVTDATNATSSPFTDFFGPTLLKGAEKVSTAEALAGKKAVAIYFSAHWCPPCRGFTPKLAEMYSATFKAKGMEIVFASSDRDFQSNPANGSSKHKTFGFLAN